MSNSSLCDYSDAYIPVKGTTTVANIATAGANANHVGKKKYLKIVLHLLIA